MEENKKVTIEVSAEIYQKLIDLANEMTTQDPRGTRMPHLFQIRDWKRVYDWGLNGDTKVWIDNSDGYSVIETFEEFIEYLDNCGIDHPDEEDLRDMWNDGYASIEWNNEEIDISEFINNYTSLQECSYSEEAVYSNSFLTAKAAEEHLKRNDYHYHAKADVYLNHAWRNPEAELVSEFLCGLVDKKMHT